MPKYKVGDRLKIIDKKWGHQVEIGEIYPVLEVSKSSTIETPYRMSQKMSCWVGDDEVELVTDQPELEFETIFLITI